jgi:pyrroline-5-carboxylate reductase
MIALIGAGNMGFAMLSSWCAQGIELVVIEPNPSAQVQQAQKEKGFLLNPQEKTAMEAVVLAVKPDRVLAAIEKNKALFGQKTLLISIAAGVELKNLCAASGIEQAVRAMPNTPAAIGEGFIALYATPTCSSAQKAFAQKLMAALGKVAFLSDEELMDAMTVLSGCGPAYLFYLAEVLVEAGVGLGLNKTLARTAVIQTLLGSAHLLEQNPNPQALRKQVTSPNGVTEAAFDVLLDNNKEPLKKVFAEAFARALKRSKDLKG